MSIEPNRRKRCRTSKVKLALTLLELLLVIALISGVSSVFGWKTYQAVQRRQFLTQVAQFRNRLFTCKMLATNMQSDWKGVFENHTFFVYCSEDPETAAAPLLKLGALEMTIDGKKQSRCCFQFMASGEMEPRGRLEIDGAHGEKKCYLLPTLEEML